MDATGTFKNTLTRQQAETVKIEQTDRPLLNSRIGFRANYTLRMNASLSGRDVIPTIINCMYRPCAGKLVANKLIVLKV